MVPGPASSGTASGVVASGLMIAKKPANTVPNCIQSSFVRPPESSE
jgi:hypothetical protein